MTENSAFNEDQTKAIRDAMADRDKIEAEGGPDGVALNSISHESVGLFIVDPDEMSPEELLKEQSRAREHNLHRLLAEISCRYRQEAQPIIDELLAIEMCKPPKPVLIYSDDSDAIRGIAARLFPGQEG